MTFSDRKLIQFNSHLELQPEKEMKFAEFLLDQTEEAAFCLGANAQFFYVNNATCKMTEYSRGELLSMTMAEIDVDFSPQTWLEQWRKLQSQNSLTFKSCYQTKKGQIFVVQITLTYIQQQNQEFACAFAHRRSNETVELSEQQWIDSLRDANENLQEEISQLKQKETQLETSLSLLRSTLESTANGIIAVSFEGDILSFNQKFVEMWQIPNSLMLSRKCPRCKTFFETQVKEPATFRRLLWEVSGESDGESYDILELTDGRIFAHYSQPQWVDEKIVGRVWSVWDITESKRTEEALRLNEARFRTLAETTEAIIFLIQGTQLCYVNPAAEVLTGYTKTELLNNFALRRLIKSKKRRQVRNLGEATNSEYQEMKILTKNGMERWLACTVTVLDGMVDFSQKPVELITAIDITDYKLAEEEVRQALEQAKELSELRSRFVAMVCHQFRTPLNVVSFSNSLLKRHMDQWTGEKKRPLLDRIQTAVEQINQLLDEILLFGKAEAAQLKLEPKPFYLIPFCEDIVAKMEMSCDQTSIVFLILNYCPTVYLDQKLLEQILTNLLENAIKYSPKGSVVELNLSYQNEKVIFQIKDSGIGIPAADRKRLFEPFYRGSNVDNIPGTGLGLSIVKTLVDLQGGEIAVESQVNEGTTFTVTLPSVE